MTVFQLVYFLVRLAAIWMLVSAVQSSAIVFSLFLGSSQFFGVERQFPVFIPLVIFVAGAIILWKKTGVIAQALTHEDAQSTDIEMPPGGFFRAGCCLIGLLCIVSAVPVLVAFGVAGVELSNDDEYVSQLNIVYRVSGPVTELVLGFLLLLKSDWLYRLANEGVSVFRR